MLTQMDTASETRAHKLAMRRLFARQSARRKLRGDGRNGTVGGAGGALGYMGELLGAGHGEGHTLPLRIFVYELPIWANTKIIKRNPWCTDSVFGTEQFIHEAILNNTFGVRTWDPEDADFFYVPIYPTCLVYRDFGNFKKYRYLIERVLEHIVNDYPYWVRSHGRDHIWPFVHDFGGCLSWLDNTDRVYFENLRHSIFLSHLGDLNVGCFQTYKDVVIPPMVSDPYLVEQSQGGLTIPPAQRKTFAHFRGTVNWCVVGGARVGGVVVGGGGCVVCCLLFVSEAPSPPSPSFLPFLPSSLPPFFPSRTLATLRNPGTTQTRRQTLR